MSAAAGGGKMNAGASAGGDTRCGYIAIVGAPNAGKSTLLNRLVGAKVAIVTPKPQTTRSRAAAIAIAGPAQMIFVDTPGIFLPRRRLDRAMVHAAWASMADAEIVVLLVDAARGLDDDTRRIVEGLKDAGRRAVLALNKIDAVAREALLGLAARLNADGGFTDTFMISALNGDGVNDLKQRLAGMLPHGPWLYPADQLADISERLLAAEVTREKLYMRLQQELPYTSTVETESWKDLADGAVRIEQTIYVMRDSQKPIVLGEGGRTIKAIGSAARADLEKMFERRVHLFLFVKVRPDWIDEPERYRAMGLDFSE